MIIIRDHLGLPLVELDDPGLDPEDDADDDSPGDDDDPDGDGDDPGILWGKDDAMIDDEPDEARGGDEENEDEVEFLWWPDPWPDGKGSWSQPFSLIIWANSMMNLPSLYFWDDSNACSYFHPRVVLQHSQKISATACNPVNKTLSSAWPHPTFTTELNKYARPYF